MCVRFTPHEYTSFIWLFSQLLRNKKVVKLVNITKKKPVLSNLVPVRDICSICNDKKGILSKKYCRDNPKSKEYDNDLFGDTDYMDCWVFIRANETKEEYKARMLKDRGIVIE